MHILNALWAVYRFKLYYNTVYTLKKVVFKIVQALSVIYLAVFIAIYFITGEFNTDEAVFGLLCIIIVNIVDIIFFNYKRIPISYYIAVNDLKSNANIFSLLVCLLTLVVHGFLISLLFIFFTEIDVNTILLYTIFIILILLGVYSFKNLELNKSNKFAIRVAKFILGFIVVSTIIQVFKYFADLETTSRTFALFGLYWGIYFSTIFVLKIEEYDGLRFNELTMHALSLDIEPSYPNSELVEYSKEIKNGITVVLSNTDLWGVFYILVYRNGVNMILEGELKCTNKIVVIDMNSFNNQKLLLGKTFNKLDFINKMIDSSNSLVILNISLDDLTENEIEKLIENSINNKVIVLVKNEILFNRGEVIG